MITVMVSKMDQKELQKSGLQAVFLNGFHVLERGGYRLA